MRGLMLAPGEMPWDVFPLDVWSRLHKRMALQLGGAAFRTGDPAGWMPLRRELGVRIGAVLGRPVSASQLLILPSRGAALRLVAGVLLDGAREAWLESPGDLTHRAALLAAIGSPIGFRADESGIQVALARGAMHNARFAITSIGASMPLGTRSCNARRAAMHHWACGVDGWFIEDDLGGNLLLDPQAGPAGIHPRSVLVGSFAKLVAPGIDLAYVLAPTDIVERLLAELMLGGNQAVTLHQATLQAFLADPAFDAHLALVRREAAARHDAFRSGITRYLEPGQRLRADPMSFTATIDLPDAVRERLLLHSCRGAGFGLLGLSDFCDPALPSHGLVLGFGAAAPSRLETEAARLGMLLRAQVAPGRRARSVLPALDPVATE